MNASHQPAILVVDDDRNIRESIRMALEQEQLHVLTAHDASSAWRILQQRVVDALILDIRLGEDDGLAFYRQIRTDGASVPTIFISGQATLTEAAQAVKLGAFDFLEKPFSAEKIAVTVKRCLEYASLRTKLSLLEADDLTTRYVGESQVVKTLLAAALKVAATDACVLIQGQSGTGKELIANVIHENGKRRSQPLVKVNCAAIPESLVESELFGHERGAFSGATSAKRGLFEIAHRGTIFLDEIGDLSLAAQAKVLRVLQSGEIQKLGSEHTLSVDVRVLSATHKNLQQCVREGRFREDLFYRLHVVPLTTPALCERPDDIPLLVTVLLRRLCKKHNIAEKPMDDDVTRELMRFAWPGNVRELQNVLERMLILSEDRISMEHLPDDLVRAPPSDWRPASAESRMALGYFRDSAERDYIIATLKRHNGNVTKSAASLEIGRTYLHKRMLVLGIAKRDYQ